MDGTRLTLIEGLNEPRDPAFFDDAGNLYVAESGVFGYLSHRTGYAFRIPVASRGVSFTNKLPKRPTGSGR